MTAVAKVGELMVKDAMVMSTPKVAAVIPWTKCVFCPAITTFNIC